MTNKESILKIKEYVETKFSAEGSGHDWWHMYRVWQLAKTIAKREKDADMFVVELAALLHDVVDAKLNDTTAGRKEIQTLLKRNDVPDVTIKAVLDAVHNTSFSSSLPGTKAKQSFMTLEAQIISDADKLDAIGAIGIARAFAYGGNKHRMLYDPTRPHHTYTNAEEYHSSTTPTISHFYEKLLLLKDRLYTQAAKELAAHRHMFMEAYLDEFYKEWEGER